MHYFAYSTMATNPDTLVLIISLMAFFIGPCLFISLYTITYIIDFITLHLSPNHQPPFELGPETLVSCPDGLCYLAMFRKDLYDKVIQQVGRFPSIYALSTYSLLIDQVLSSTFSCYEQWESCTPTWGLWALLLFKSQPQQLPWQTPTLTMEKIIWHVLKD